MNKSDRHVRLRKPHCSLTRLHLALHGLVLKKKEEAEYQRKLAEVQDNLKPVPGRQHMEVCIVTDPSACGTEE